jgi:hypothetical protein
MKVLFLEKVLMGNGKILQIDDDANILHVEMQTSDGETVVGVYQLMGWTSAPKKVKAKAELELWVPTKVTHSIQ